jgi:sec-independent protein translocase protein TatB
MSFSHLLILGIIAVIVIPPEKLPEVARQVAKFLGEMRRMTSGVFDDLRKDVVLTPEDMLKRSQQQQQAQQPQEPASAQENTIHATDMAVPANATPFNPPMIISEEQQKKADEDYQKHIAAAEEKKPNHE